MADFTPNYNLKKPLRTEYYNVADANGNSDIVDTQLKAVNDRVDLVEGEVDSLELGKADKTYVDAQLAEKASKTPGEWVQLTLMNGWTGTLNIRKNEIGEIEFNGISLVAGTVALNTVISVVPVGLRVLPTIVPLACYDGSSGNIVYVMARNNGNIVLGNGFVSGRTYQLGATRAVI